MDAPIKTALIAWGCNTAIMHRLIASMVSRLIYLRCILSATGLHWLMKQEWRRGEEGGAKQSGERKGKTVEKEKR